MINYFSNKSLKTDYNFITTSNERFERSFPKQKSINNWLKI